MLRVEHIFAKCNRPQYSATELTITASTLILINNSITTSAIKTKKRRAVTS